MPEEKQEGWEPCPNDDGSSLPPSHSNGCTLCEPEPWEERISLAMTFWGLETYQAKNADERDKACKKFIGIVRQIRAEAATQAVAEERKRILEALPRTYTFYKADWGDGVTSDEPVEDDSISLAQAKMWNKCVAETRKIIDPK